MNRKKIITNNREVYEKFNMLNFSSEIMLRNVKPVYIERILKNINERGNVLDMELIGDYIVVKKLNPINFHVYLR